MSWEGGRGEVVAPSDAVVFRKGSLSPVAIGLREPVGNDWTFGLPRVLLRVHSVMLTGNKTEKQESTWCRNICKGLVSRLTGKPSSRFS